MTTSLRSVRILDVQSLLACLKDDLGQKGLAPLDTPEGTVLASGPVRTIHPGPHTPTLKSDAPRPDTLPQDAVLFTLESNDAAEYRISVCGLPQSLLIRRIPSPLRIARREIQLPASRPVILYVEALDDVSQEGLQQLVRLVEGHGRPPLLAPGSVIAVP